MKRRYWLSLEKAALRMAYLAATVRSRRMHLELAAQHSLEAEALEPEPAAAAPVPRVLRSARRMMPQFLRARRQPSKPQEPPKPLVLICDDDEPVLDILEHHLSNAGYKVVRAVDGALAMQRLAERMPAVVILAIMIPAINGLEVLRRIRQDPKTREVPVIILTHRSGEQDVVEALRLGASDYMTKPFLIGELLERVSKNVTPYEYAQDSQMLKDCPAICLMGS